jgi:DNA helicase II / ATP-dependent DNA helicase PcrA
MQQQNFKDFFEQHLNTEQQKAVKQKNGSLLVIAGAGSGKTRVITSRIINLIINENIAPESIIALTFTNKAALEMKERIMHFLGAKAQKTFIGTFHSYCLYLLRNNASLLPYPSFSILDSDDQQHMLQSIIKRNGLQKKITAKNLGYQISMKKNSSLDDAPAIQDSFFEQLYRAYEHEKTISKSFDFDDLLLEVLKLFTTNKLFKSRFQEKIQHILIDEYQDTNVVQHALLKQMALTEKEFTLDSLCAVGDEDQSIYSWRGATVANIMHFKNDFPNTTTIKIEQNYRSVQPILTIANHVIEHNTQRNPKKLWSNLEASNCACILTCLSDYQESETIAQSLKAALRSKKCATQAVLYRAHYQSRTIEEALLRNGIAYKIVGGIQFYERKEIKDILAYIRLVANPFDRVSFFRIVNTPARGLGEKFEQDIQELWNQQPLSTFYDCIAMMLQAETVTGKKAQSLKEFGTVFKKITINDKPSHCINHIIYETDYYAYLKENFEPKEAETKIENIKELLRAASHFEQRSDGTTITDFLHEIALMQEKINEQESAPEQVFLMTLHSAKGLEFDMVILSGLEEGVFPSNHSIYSSEAVEEERRLFYVGITRAKKYIIKTHSRYRYTFGSMSDQRPSRFLHEIPEQLAQKQDVSHWSSSEIYSFFNSWFGTTLKLPPSQVLTFGTAQRTAQKPSVVIHKKKYVIEKEPLRPDVPKNGSPFKKLQAVKHVKFGTGIVEHVEQKDETTFYVTAKFKSGTKKIKADFLERV